MKTFDSVYDTMLGLRMEGFKAEGVENAFEEGSFCAEKYEVMRNAYARVCQRLEAGDEDRDLEIMVSAMEHIQRELCRRFYAMYQE